MYRYPIETGRFIGEGDGGGSTVDGGRGAELHVDLPGPTLKRTQIIPLSRRRCGGCTILIYGPRRRSEFLPRNATPEDRLARWLDQTKDQEVHDVDALAMIAALYLHRQAYPRDFKLDRHFRYQLVIRFLRMVRAPGVEMWGGGRPIYRYDRIAAAVRDMLGKRLEAHPGLLCLRMARLLNPNPTLEQGTTQQ